ncbi:MAG: hypothetical protein ACFFB0_19165 [Promethearchaeota archaeon]
MHKVKKFLNHIYLGIQSVFETSVFEIKKQWKKFIAFSLITVFLILFYKWYPYILKNDPISETLLDFYWSDPMDIALSLTLTGTFFFSGIICSEFVKKTGYMTFPKIHGYKLLIGKFLGNYVLLLGIITLYYFMLGLLGFYFYGPPLNVRLLYAYSIALLFIFTLGSFITFFSALMKTESITIVSSLLLILIGFPFITVLIGGLLPDLEPYYSIEYLQRLLYYIYSEDLPLPRKERFTDDFIGENFRTRTWLTPSISGGIVAMIIYSALCLLGAALLFKRREL